MLNLLTAKPQQVYRRTVLLWFLLVIAHLAWYLIRAFTAPPSDEVYASQFGFQLLAYGLTQLPYWVLALVVLLLCEFFLLGRRRSSDQGVP